MDGIWKFLILFLLIVVAIPVAPIVAHGVMPTWGVDHDLAKGTLEWRPLRGVLVERHLGDNLWEQFIVDWIGPGTVLAVQYADAGGDPLLDANVTRERLGTKELRVTIEIARMYTLADSPDSFPVVIAQKYSGDTSQGLWSTNGKEIDTVYGSVFFAPTAAIEVVRGGRFGFRALRPGDVLVLHENKWSLAGPGGAPAGPSTNGVASFTVLKGVRTARPMALENRIATVSLAMSATGPAAADSEEGLIVDRDPLADSGGSTMNMLRASAWEFPLPKDIDLTHVLSSEQRDAMNIGGAIAAGWGYAHDEGAIPSPKTAWNLRCLQETEIWVPYRSPL